MIYDGSRTARCIIRTTAVHVAPLNSVSEAFAWQEGEGDRSVEYWLEGHRRFFRSEHEALGVPFSDSIPVIFEEFVVVWPQEIADRR
ncbi:MAG: ASCH domain-containing protein [Alkalispirochaeta sp.]